MLVANCLAVKCPNCGSSTRYQETCQWCSKPIAVQPRHPTELEAKRYTYEDKTVRKRRTEEREYQRDTDEILIEIELVQARYSYSDKKIATLLKYNDILGELRSGRRLRFDTRARVRNILKEYQ